MANLELVIKIDEDTYNHFIRNEYSRADVIAMHTALVNGIPLYQLRAEIERLTITEGGEDYIRKMAELYSLKIKVLQIIDKYRESED